MRGVPPLRWAAACGWPLFRADAAPGCGAAGRGRGRDVDLAPAASGPAGPMRGCPRGRCCWGTGRGPRGLGVAIGGSLSGLLVWRMQCGWRVAGGPQACSPWAPSGASALGGLAPPPAGLPGRSGGPLAQGGAAALTAEPLTDTGTSWVTGGVAQARSGGAEAGEGRPCSCGRGVCRGGQGAPHTCPPPVSASDPTLGCPPAVSWATLCEEVLCAFVTPGKAG